MVLFTNRRLAQKNLVGLYDLYTDSESRRSFLTVLTLCLYSNFQRRLWVVISRDSRIEWKWKASPSLAVGAVEMLRHIRHRVAYSSLVSTNPAFQTPQVQSGDSLIGFSSRLQVETADWRPESSQARGKHSRQYRTKTSVRSLWVD